MPLLNEWKNRQEVQYPLVQSDIMKGSKELCFRDSLAGKLLSFSSGISFYLEHFYLNNVIKGFPAAVTNKWSSGVWNRHLMSQDHEALMTAQKYRRLHSRGNVTEHVSTSSTCNDELSVIADILRITTCWSEVAHCVETPENMGSALLNTSSLKNFKEFFKEDLCGLNF